MSLNREIDNNPEIEFKDSKQLDMNTMPILKNIINAINDNPGITGKELAEMFEMSSMQIRKYIGDIRKNNGIFFPVSKRFIIAERSGYILTNEIKKIKHWANKMQKRGTSALEQVNQAWKITDKNW